MRGPFGGRHHCTLLRGARAAHFVRRNEACIVLWRGANSEAYNSTPRMNSGFIVMCSFRSNGSWDGTAAAGAWRKKAVMERDSLRCFSIFPKCLRGKLSLHTPLHWNF